ELAEQALPLGLELLQRLGGLARLVLQRGGALELAERVLGAAGLAVLDARDEEELVPVAPALRVLGRELGEDLLGLGVLAPRGETRRLVETRGARARLVEERLHLLLGPAGRRRHGRRRPGFRQGRLRPRLRQPRRPRAGGPDLLGRGGRGRRGRGGRRR